MNVAFLMPHDGRGESAVVCARRAIQLGLDFRDLSEMNSFSSAEWKEVERNYIHASPNPEAFELACIKRYFYVLEYAERHKINRFIMMDSDLFLFPSIMQYSDRFTSSSGEVGLSLNMAAGIEGAHFSPHCSFWSLDLMRSFTTFILETYSDNKNFLHVTSSYMKDGEGHISDMQLLHAWTVRRNIGWVDTGNPWRGMVVDHNISTRPPKNSLKKRPNWRVLVIRDIYAVDLVTGRHLVALHFQGAAKKLLKFAESRNSLLLNLGILGLNLARMARAKLSSFGVNR
jgi:hypothetical protein